MKIATINELRKLIIDGLEKGITQRFGKEEKAREILEKPILLFEFFCRYNQLDIDNLVESYKQKVIQDKRSIEGNKNISLEQKKKLIENHNSFMEHNIRYLKGLQDKFNKIKTK